ncbi:MAG TPA: SHOCT domain-containing protein [Allosphingosinicella sp.]|jgi:hypothetical protein
MDRITALERLAQLRSSGNLSDSEFEVEKQRILAAADGRPRSPRRGRLALAGLALAGTAVAAGWMLAPDAEPVAPAAKPRPTTKATSPLPAAAAEPEPSVRELSTQEQLTEAFRAAYGSRKSATLKRDGSTYVVRPASLEWIGDKAVLLTLAGIPDACHGCSGAIGVHYLVPAGKNFAVQERWPLFVPGSSWGEPATEWSIRRDLSTYPVVASEGGHMGQGYLCQWTSLAELTPARPVLLGTFSTGFSDEGARVDGEAVTNWDGRITKPVRGRSFQIAVSGSDHFTERYVRRGDKFVPAHTSRFSEHCG